MSSKEAEQLQFVDATKSPGIRHKTRRLVPWVKAADEDYFQLLLEGFGPDDIIADWMRCADSELALQNMRLLIADDRIAGGYIGFAGRQLHRRRERDLIDLIRRFGSARQSKLRRRLKDLMSLFGPVEPNDYYLSKIGTAPGLDDPSLEQKLVEDCIERAGRAGYDRLRTDIDESDRRLRDLLATNGFEQIDWGCAERAGLVFANLMRTT